MIRLSLGDKEGSKTPGHSPAFLFSMWGTEKLNRRVVVCRSSFAMLELYRKWYMHMFGVGYGDRGCVYEFP